MEGNAWWKGARRRRVMEQWRHGTVAPWKPRPCRSATLGQRRPSQRFRDHRSGGRHADRRGGTCSVNKRLTPPMRPSSRPCSRNRPPSSSCSASGHTATSRCGEATENPCTPHRRYRTGPRLDRRRRHVPRRRCALPPSGPTPRNGDAAGEHLRNRLPGHARRNRPSHSGRGRPAPPGRAVGGVRRDS